MARGTLRIYLGAAPGVGKTYAMLDEGCRRASRGTDVVVGFVETYGRPKPRLPSATSQIVPRHTITYRGAEFTEMDVDAVRRGDRRRWGDRAGAGRQPAPEVMVLDLGLDLDGVEVIQGLRPWFTPPIVVLSARQDSDDKVGALDAGADDYVTRPFGMDELLARLRAALRRSAPVTDDAVVRAASFTVDLAAKRVTVADREVRLTPTEWGVLEQLVRHPGRLISQRQLLQEVWGPAYRTHELPARLPRSAAAQAGARPVAPPPPHHRVRHGLPLRAVTLPHR